MVGCLSYRVKTASAAGLFRHEPRACSLRVLPLHLLHLPFTKMTSQQTKIALRINDDNINHHLWNNRGVWWCHVTVHKPDATAERLRFSLRTRDIEKARTLRDRIFADIQRHFGIAT